MNTLTALVNMVVPGVLLPITTYGTWRLSNKIGIKVMYVVYCILLGFFFNLSLVGAISPLRQLIFLHTDVLSQLSNLAVNCMCFMGGIEIMEAFRLRMTGKMLKISVPTILIQGLIAIALTLLLPHIIPGAQGWFLAIWLVCCTIALPMLMSTLMSLGWTQTRLGRFSMVMSAFTEVCLWLGVIALTVLSGHNSNPLKIVGFLLFSIVMLFIVRPILQFVWAKGNKNRILAACLVAALLVLSPQITNFLGFQAVIGAVGAGLVVPIGMQLYIQRWKLEKLVLYGISPFFLVSVGLLNKFDFSDMYIWAVCAILIITSAAVQLSLSAFLTRKFAGFYRREALALGACVLNKGMVEIVLSTILVKLGVLSGLLQQGIILAAVILMIFSPLAAKVAAGKDRLIEQIETY